MFTGIVTGIGEVVRIDENPFGVRLLIDPRRWSHVPTHGDSVCTSGVCLTHAPRDDDPPGTLAFDVIRETLSVTSLGSLAVGSRVNLEASVRPDQPMAGHFVQGHVDTLGKVARVESGDDEWRTTIAIDPTYMKYMVPKGSVALDGVSLTIAAIDVDAATLTVALIPTTLDLTIMGGYEVGDPVNVETDMIARTIVHVLEMQQRGDDDTDVSIKALQRAGFVR